MHPSGGHVMYSMTLAKGMAWTKSKGSQTWLYLDTMMILEQSQNKPGGIKIFFLVFWHF
jgi:hypothetical protein